MDCKNKSLRRKIALSVGSFLFFGGAPGVCSAPAEFSPVPNLDPQITAVSVPATSLLKASAGGDASSCHRLAMNGSLLFSALGSDASFTPYLEIPVKLIQGLVMACASLTLEAQDIGPFVPNAITAVAKKGEKLFFLKTHVNLSEITACKKVWDVSQKKVDRLFGKYRASGLKDNRAFEDSRKEEKEGFARFRRCFAEHFPKTPEFSGAVKRASEIVEPLVKIDGRH